MVFYFLTPNLSQGRYRRLPKLSKMKQKQQKQRPFQAKIKPYYPERIRHIFGDRGNVSNYPERIRHIRPGLQPWCLTAPQTFAVLQGRDITHSQIVCEIIPPDVAPFQGAECVFLCIPGVAPRADMYDPGGIANCLWIVVLGLKP